MDEQNGFQKPHNKSPQKVDRLWSLQRNFAHLFSVVWGEGGCCVRVDSVLPEGLLKTRRRSSRCITPLRVVRTCILCTEAARARILCPVVSSVVPCDHGPAPDAARLVAASC